MQIYQSILTLKILSVTKLKMNLSKYEIYFKIKTFNSSVSDTTNSFA